MEVILILGCNNCGGCCIIKVYVKGGNIIKLIIDIEEESVVGL